jgi:hypothetical protein
LSRLNWSIHLGPACEKRGAICFLPLFPELLKLEEKKRAFLLAKNMHNDAGKGSYLAKSD